MKKACSFLILLFLVIQSNGQFKTVRFEVLDKITKKPVAGVTASPDFAGDSAVSNEQGLLKIKVPKRYKDSVTLTREDYFPLVAKIISVPPGNAITVFMTHSPSNVDTLLFIDNIENRLAAGKVYHFYQGNRLDSVTLRLSDNKILGFTDSKGEYVVAVPRSLDSLNLFLEGYRPMKISSRSHGPFGLVPINPHDSDLQRVKWKNVLSISPMELMRGGIGVRYERFINNRHALGLHTSYYFFNKTTNILLQDDDTDWAYIIEEFDGIKLAPFYRYYLKKNAMGGNYLEAKPITGYFYFPGRPDSNENPYYFWTFGGGAAWGIMTIKHDSHLTMNLTFGLQYFPMQDPQNAYNESYNTDWWYFLGPGSIVEIKFTLGGLF